MIFVLAIPTDEWRGQGALIYSSFPLLFLKFVKWKNRHKHADMPYNIDKPNKPDKPEEINKLDKSDRPNKL